MLAGRTPRMIYSHKDRLAEPQLPKYVPFTHDGGSFVLKFQIPVEVLGIQPTATPLFSMHASSFHPFAGMAALSLNPHTGPHSLTLPPRHISKPVPPVYPLHYSHTPPSYVNPSLHSPSSSPCPMSDTSAAGVVLCGGAEDGGAATCGDGPDNWIENNSFIPSPSDAHLAFPCILPSVLRSTSTTTSSPSLSDFLFSASVPQLPMHGDACVPVDVVVGVVPMNESVEALMDMSVCLATDDVHVTSHGGEDAQMTLIIGSRLIPWES